MTVGTPILGVGVPTAVVFVELWAPFGPGAFVPLRARPILGMVSRRSLVTVRLVTQL